MGLAPIHMEGLEQASIMAHGAKRWSVRQLTDYRFPCHCLEVIIMRGRSSEVRQIADRILSLRGVKHRKLVLTTQGKDL